MSGMTYSPLFIFRFFFLFSVYLFDNFLRLRLRWGIKKTLIDEKKASSSICKEKNFRFWSYLFISLFLFKYTNFLFSLYIIIIFPYSFSSGYFIFFQCLLIFCSLITRQSRHIHTLDSIPFFIPFFHWYVFMYTIK